MQATVAVCAALAWPAAILVVAWVISREVARDLKLRNERLAAEIEARWHAAEARRFPTREAWDAYVREAARQSARDAMYGSAQESAGDAAGRK